MSTTADSELLERYARDGSESAFTELVERYLPLVRGVIWRRSQRADIVDDVAMQVFASMARKAAALQKRPSIGGWLVVATRNKVAECLRSEDSRRRAMEKLSAQGHSPDTIHDSQWEDAAPFIDDALASLAEKDREAVVLRFYQGIGYRDIALRIGTREDAARKRIQKALQRMSGILRAKGIAFTTTILTAGLSARLTTESAAAGTASASAIAKASIALSAKTAAGPSLSSIILTMTHSKFTAAGVALVLLALSTGAGFLSGQHLGALKRNTILAAAASAPRLLGNLGKFIPAEEESPGNRLRRVLGKIASASTEVSSRPGAWADVMKWRKELGAADYAEAIQIARTDFPSRPELLSYLLSDWAQHDAQAATEMVVSITGPEKWEDLLSATLPPWARAAAPDALKWLDGKTPELGSGVALRLRAATYGGWAQGDPVAALDSLESLSFDEQREITRRLWPAVRDETVRKRFVDRVAQITDENLRHDFFEKSIAESLRNDPQAIAAVFDQLNFADQGIRQRALNYVGDQLFGKDPTAAVAWMWDRIADDHHDEFVTEWVKNGWAKMDHAAAATWAKQRGYSLDKEAQP